MGHEVSYTGLVRSPVRRVQMAKATCKCGEPRNGKCGLHQVLLGWVVKSGQKRSHTLPCSAQIRTGGHRGQERVELVSLRPHASAAHWGMQEVSYTELSEV